METSGLRVSRGQGARGSFAARQKTVPLMVPDPPSGALLFQCPLLGETERVRVSMDFTISLTGDEERGYTVGLILPQKFLDLFLQEAGYSVMMVSLHSKWGMPSGETARVREMVFGMLTDATNAALVAWDDLAFAIDRIPVNGLVE